MKKEVNKAEVAGPKLTLPIEIGRKYVRRDGKVVTAQKHKANSSALWKTVLDGHYDEGYSDTGRQSFYKEYPSDLIADAPEEPEYSVGGYVGYADRWTPTTLPLPNYTEEPKTYFITDYADVLRAIADGKTIQLLGHNTAKFVEVSSETALGMVVAQSVAPRTFRIKPDTIIINGHEVP